MKQKFLLKSFFIFFLFILNITNITYANLRIEIKKGRDDARPIAILPFAWNVKGQPPEKMSEVILADLQNSGKFTPLAEVNMPQVVTKIREIAPELWLQAGVKMLVMGSIEPIADNNYKIYYELVEIDENKKLNILIRNQFKVKARWLRFVGHTISDEIYKNQLKIAGVFRTRIAYVVKRNDVKDFKYELHVSDYDGHNKSVIHRSPQPIMSPAWSPDGKKIAYVTFLTGRSKLIIQNLSDATSKILAEFPRHNGAPAFSPDGEKIVFALSKEGSLNLYLLELKTGKITQLTSNRNNNTEPSWFPDSEHISYTSDQSGLPQLYKIDIKGGEPKRLTWASRKSQNSVVSSDGKFIIFVNTDEKGKQHIARQNITTGEVSILTDTFLDEMPTISPNGAIILYISKQGLGTKLQLVSTDGRFKATLPVSDGHPKFPAWSPQVN